ncbi:MAG: PepSY-associated TM helix domain-containing protein [Pseudomonadota bacterium]
MKATFRQSMAWLHTWSGLLVGWLLFAIFLTGTASYYRQEISLWMRPELRMVRIAPSEAADRAIDRLQEIGQGAWQWVIDLPTERNPTTEIVFRREPGSGPTFGRELLDPVTGKPIDVRSTYGGESLYYFHFDLLVPSIWGRLIVGFCAVTMLVAIISGIITHRRFFRDFFTFRPRKGQRSWLDAHNAMGVMALPYHILITYTGIVPLLFLYMPWGVDVAYSGDRSAFLQDSGVVTTDATDASGQAAPLAALAPMLAAASRLWDGGQAGRIVIDHPDDAASRVIVYRSGTETLSHRAEGVVFNGSDGELVDAQMARSTATRFALFFYGLHLGRFAEPVLRGLLFLSGLAGTGVVATGLILWSVARRRRTIAEGRAPGFGLRTVDKLNLAAILGLPAGIAALFWANRLLPLDMASRADREVECFFLAWLVVAVVLMLRPLNRAWIDGLWLNAALFGLLPALNAVTTNRHLADAIATGSWQRAGFDLTVLGFGVAFASTAWTLNRKVRPTAAANLPRPATRPSPEQVELVE